MCTCSATGDPHYRTYDGQMIHFMGVCKYLMTKSLTKNDPCAFSVEVKNEHRGRNRRVAYTRSVDVKIYGKVVRLAPGHKVFVRHSTFFLIKITAVIQTILLQRYCYAVQSFSGRKIVWFGLFLDWWSQEVPSCIRKQWRPEGSDEWTICPGRHEV